MEEVKNITYQPKTNNCVVCGTKFVYERQTMKYCSNACKCKAYQTRQTKNKLTKRINGTPGISLTRSKQKIVPAQTTFQGITEQQYIDYIKELQYVIIRAEQREKNREQRYEEFTTRRQERFDEVRKVYEEKIEELQKEVLELRKMNKMWELASKVLLGK